MHGAPKYGPDFTHFDFVNPDAPKGGTLRLAVEGTFDSFNPYIIKGNPAAGVAYETLAVTARTNRSPCTACWPTASNGPRTAPG